MFAAQLKSAECKDTGYNIIVYTDTLYEAEICITKALCNMYDSRKIILVYQYDSLYWIYDADRKIGIVQIKLG